MKFLTHFSPDTHTHTFTEYAISNKPETLPPPPTAN